MYATDRDRGKTTESRVHGRHTKALMVEFAIVPGRQAFSFSPAVIDFKVSTAIIKH